MSLEAELRFRLGEAWCGVGDSPGTVRFVRDWPALRSGLVLIARDDWRLAYVSAGAGDIHGETGDSRPADEKAGSAG
jgi:hypothetical protein